VFGECEEFLTFADTLVRNLAVNGLNGTLTIPATIGGNLTLVSLQNNSISAISQLSNSANFSGVQFA
jgi:hypothetical protein